MKVSYQSGFKPFTMTIETESELNHLLAAINTCSDTLGEQANSLSELNNFVPNPQVYGDMFCKIREVKKAMS